ncbi:DUF6035 family protein [Moritella viscosa]|uniref:DUF6035 domain-containing protein n=1 Tax=Moritella viscosa TaxID=80854 RepID=A0A1L0BKE8_9GAMM|nr:DUF6035 family protein [Moritella viscosa]SGZ04071.1 Putative uncharacterized protein [Moritella viscosa]
MYKPTIPLVLDNLVHQCIPTDYLHEFFTELELSHIRNQNFDDKRFVCFECKHPVKLTARKNDQVSGGHRYYFSHPSNVECEWKSENKSTAEIYRGVQEGIKHLQMKKLLVETLSTLANWSDVGSDDRFFFNEDHSQRRKPDVYAHYHQNKVVFEIQLRSEDPLVITGRQNFYRDLGDKLVWFSAENVDLVNDDHKANCMDVKLVQKDIAFSNNGTWYVFNELLASQSIENKKLIFLAKYFWPEVINKQIIFDWREEVIGFDQITFEDGKMIYRDSISEYNRLRIDLLSEAKKRIIDHINISKFRDWQSFLQRVKEVWPNLSILEDSIWLNQIFEETFNKRQIHLKKKIISIFNKKRDRSWTENWNKLVSATQGMGFGINRGVDLYVVEKILLILGCQLRPHLNVYQSCHNFHDHESFHPYYDLYLNARKASPISKKIGLKSSIISRELKVPVNIQQNNELDNFLTWFTSKPILPHDEVI